MTPQQVEATAIVIAVLDGTLEEVEPIPLGDYAVYSLQVHLVGQTILEHFAALEIAKVLAGGQEFKNLGNVAYTLPKFGHFGNNNIQNCANGGLSSECVSVCACVAIEYFQIHSIMECCHH